MNLKYSFTLQNLNKYQNNLNSGCIKFNITTMIKSYSYIFSLQLFICVFISCNNAVNKANMSTEKIEHITIDIDKNAQVPFDSLITNFEFIKLETNDQNMIGRISQVLFVDSSIIVIDSENAQSINVFDSNGKFKNKIGRIGNGPEEFAEISNVIIVPEKNLICVLDRPQKKILYFDLDGCFIYYERQPFMLDYFEYIDTEHKAFNAIAMYDYAYGSNRGNALLVTDSTNKIINSACEDTYRPDFNFNIKRPLRKYGDQVFFSSNLTDSIYIVEKNRVTPKYYIDIKTNPMPKLNRKKLTNKILYDYMDKHFFYNGDFAELKDFTLVNISTPWSYPFALYSHKHKEVFLTTGEFAHPLYPFFKYEPIARFQDNGLVFPIDSYILLDEKEALYKTRGYEAILDDLFEELDVDSNPVLFIYHMNTNLGN